MSVEDHLDRIRRRFSPGRAAEREARAVLEDLAYTVGGGLVAAQRLPALCAALDQHEAAIRDSLSSDTRPLDAMILAAYADGIRHQSHRHGWCPPDDPIDWSREADWPLTRLLAVCSLWAKVRTSAG